MTQSVRRLAAWLFLLVQPMREGQPQFVPRAGVISMAYLDEGVEREFVRSFGRDIQALPVGFDGHEVRPVFPVQDAPPCQFNRVVSSHGKRAPVQLTAIVDETNDGMNTSFVMHGVQQSNGRREKFIEIFFVQKFPFGRIRAQDEQL